MKNDIYNNFKRHCVDWCIPSDTGLLCGMPSGKRLSALHIVLLFFHEELRSSRRVKKNVCPANGPPFLP